MGYQGVLIEMAKEYVVLATNQSQSLMCGGQMSCNKQLMESWAPIEPQIDWNRSALLNLPQASAAANQPAERQHYVAVSQLAEAQSPEEISLPPQLPQRNFAEQLESPREAGTSRDDKQLCVRMAPSATVPEKSKSNAKEAAAKDKKRFRIFRAMRSVIKSRFRK